MTTIKQDLKTTFVAFCMIISLFGTQAPGSSLLIRTNN